MKSLALLHRQCIPDTRHRTAASKDKGTRSDAHSLPRITVLTAHRVAVSQLELVVSDERSSVSSEQS